MQMEIICDLYRITPGLRIQNNFIRPQRFDALKGFYDNYPIKYWDARRDFYRNNHIMGKWRP